MTRVASFVVLLAILAVISVAFYRVMADFLLPLFIAAFLVVIFRPLHERIVERLPGRKRVSALLTTTLVLLIVLLPIVAVGAVAMLEGAHIISELKISTGGNPISRMRKAAGIDQPAVADFRAIESSFASLVEEVHSRGDDTAVSFEVANLTTQLQRLREHPPKVTSGPELARLIERTQQWPETAEGVTLEEEVNSLQRDFRDWKIASMGGSYWAYVTELANPSDEQWKQLTSSAVSQTQPLLMRVTSSTTSVIAKLLFGGVITVVAFYFFLCDGSSMVKTVMHLSPLDDRYEQELLDEFVGISRAVLMATLLSAGVQAILAGAGYYFAGVEAMFLMMVLTGVLALIPLVGTFGAWGPVCAWLYFVEGRHGAAILLAIYCAGIVSTADNFIKPAVLHGQSRLHPLLALLSVLGGVKTLGPIGILVGPMVVVFLQTLLNILHRELVQLEGSAAGMAILAGGAGGTSSGPLGDLADYEVELPAPSGSEPESEDQQPEANDDSEPADEE